MSGFSCPAADGPGLFSREVSIVSWELGEKKKKDPGEKHSRHGQKQKLWSFMVKFDRLMQMVAPSEQTQTPTFGHILGYMVSKQLFIL